jgi:hypothetical protein
MEKGIMFVESQPVSPDVAAEYHAFYAKRLEEIVAIDGFVAARRYEPVQHEGPFVAIYDIEAEDLEAVRASLVAASMRGELPLTSAMQTDPKPRTFLFRQINAYPADG